MNLKKELLQYKGKKVLVTGHTGFKGAWICEMLIALGAEVCGYSLKPPTEPSLFKLLSLENRLNSKINDIRNLEELKLTFDEYQPEIVIHMAAQPIVRLSYRMPVETYEINVMGTVNVLECVRNSKSVKSFLNVTTDKVYCQNDNWIWGYRENDIIDGFDPYSNSKSCSEIITHSYKNSFFAKTDIAVSTVRAGNVIGGGDFAEDRIIPDCIRSVLYNKKLSIRNNNSVRPYQHVLEANSFYLLLAIKQYNDKRYEGWFNVGPDDGNCVKTEKIVELFFDKMDCDRRGWERTDINDKEGFDSHEASFLKLDCTYAKSKLGWFPKWDIEHAVEKVVEWVEVFRDHSDVKKCVDKQIMEYLEE